MLRRGSGFPSLNCIILQCVGSILRACIFRELGKIYFWTKKLIFLFLYFAELCSLPQHLCGGQRIINETPFSGSTVQVRLGGKYLYQLRHLISPHFYYKIKEVVFTKNIFWRLPILKPTVNFHVDKLWWPKHRTTRPNSIFPPAFKLLFQVIYLK